LRFKGGGKKKREVADIKRTTFRLREKGKRQRGRGSPSRNCYHLGGGGPYKGGKKGQGGLKGKGKRELAKKKKKRPSQYSRCCKWEKKKAHSSALKETSKTRRKGRGTFG